MRITTRGRYALRASIAMAQLGKDGTPVSIRQLSEKENISSVFLEQIFYKLRKAGIVVSVRGPGGGFRFSRPISELTVKDLLEAAEEGLTLSPCNEKNNKCVNADDCISCLIWEEASSVVNELFQNTTLQSLMEKYELKSLGCADDHKN